MTQLDNDNNPMTRIARISSEDPRIYFIQQKCDTSSRRYLPTVPYISLGVMTF